MKNSVLSLSVITFLFCFLLSGCSNIKESGGDAVLMKILICPNATFQDSYLFIIKENGIMQGQFGVRKNNKIQTTKSLTKISEEKEVVISDNDLKEIISLAEALEVSGYSSEQKVQKEDSWDMILFIIK